MIDKNLSEKKAAAELDFAEYEIVELTEEEILQVAGGGPRRN